MAFFDLLNSFLRRRKNDPMGNMLTTDAMRLAQYVRYLRAYQGYSIRGVTGTATPRDWKRIRFNFTQPIVNLSAGWFAAKPLDWEVEHDDAGEATAACYAIWNRSGSDAQLLEAAICCSIYGDMVVLATQDDDGEACLEFIDPSICFPTFNGSDYAQLASLEIVYQSADTQGRPLTHREFYQAQEDGSATLQVYDGDNVTSSASFDAMPCQWIRNHSVKGLPFGISDVEPIFELVEEYDHLASKQTRIVDYYASPNLYFKGVNKGDLQKGANTVYYLPTDGEAGFIEWKGSPPDVESQLTRIRNAIAEISQVPAVAFGQADSGLTSISGVAIQILYGPLLSKTHRKQACWSPALEAAMWMALRADGYAVDREDVKCHFTSGTPVDGQSMVAEASAKVAAKLTSRRTQMQDLGIENPDSELKRIVIEEKLLQLAQPAPVIEQDANVAAKAGARGMFAQEIPEGIGANKPQPQPETSGTPSVQPMAGGTGSTQSDLAGDITTLLTHIDALLDAENTNIEAAEAPAGDSDGED